MEREIKFRVWNGENMISPDYVDRKGFAYWKENSIPRYDNNIMQFTGFIDKKFVDIYEGDKLINPSKEIGIVVWYNSGFSLKCVRRNKAVFYIPLDAGFINNKTVVGNIYQNPEL